MSSLKSEIASLLSEALKKCSEPADSAAIALSFEIPREEKFGDLSNNIVLKLARQSKKTPRALADDTVKHFNELLNHSPIRERVLKGTVEGPGFLNFYFSPTEIVRVIPEIREKGTAFGRPALPPKNILLEFVSANPTGPLTVAHGRQAALGDSLARILRFCGHRVTTEYYNNDEGVQIETLGKSTMLRLTELLQNKKIEMPENYYRGAYLVATAMKLANFAPKALAMPEEERLKLCTHFAKNDILSGIQKDLAEFDVQFDQYYSQAELAESGLVEKTLDELKKRNRIYEKDGAVWLKTTDFADDKDRVLVKSDHTYTYLTPDIAYHHEKFGRGFDELINIWGPDHHGYIARLLASQSALGHDAKRIRILIAQLVTLYEGGKQVRMSTRAGEFVTLREIIDEVGKDAGRFFFVMRKFDAHLDFDLALAKTQTPENPVFYIQYAHARIESIKALCREKGVSVDWNKMQCLARLSEAGEIRLLRLLWQWEETIVGAERTLEPYRLVPYLMELAAGFHKFYADHRIVSEDSELTQARLLLVESIQTVIRSGLELLGVSAPLKM